MLVAVVGGNLQGVEATYLAKKAGWEVVLIDRRSIVPASGLCDRFIRLDVTGGENLSKTLKINLRSRLWINGPAKKASRLSLIWRPF